MSEVTKTYYMTTKRENTFPVDFVNSTNKRFIEVHPAYLSRTKCKPEEFDKNIFMHADFIDRDAYLDYSVCLCNERRTKYKKYEYRSCKDTFRLWFTDSTPEISRTTLRLLYNVGNAISEDDMLANLIKLYPEHEEEIERLYTELEYSSWSKYFDLLYLARFSNPNVLFYTVYDFADHVANLYGRKVPYTNVVTKIKGPTPIVDYIVYTRTTTYFDNYMLKKIEEQDTIKYRNIGDKYKFVAEFLLIY